MKLLKVLTFILLLGFFVQTIISSIIVKQNITNEKSSDSSGQISSTNTLAEDTCIFTTSFFAFYTLLTFILFSLTIIDTGRYQEKLYITIVFVGSFVNLLLGIMVLTKKEKAVIIGLSITSVIFSLLSLVAIWKTIRGMRVD